MNIKLKECPGCDSPLGQPYQCSHMGMMYCEFFECPNCGKEFSHVYQFSHLESDDEEDDES